VRRVTISTTPEPARTGTGREPTAEHLDRSRAIAPTGPTADRFARELTPAIEAVAVTADARAHGPWRAPAVVAAVTYIAGVAVLVILGWVLVHTPLGAPIRDWDQTISLDLANGRSSGWSDYSEVGTSGANTLPVIGAMVLVSLVLAALRRWRDLIFLPIGLALELSIFLTVNYLVARERPDVPQLGGEPGTHSFPSGHVAATFVLCASIAILLGIGRWRRPYQLLGWLIAMVPVASVAFSRVYRGMHFTTDVLAGLGLGLIALTAAMIATRASWLGSRPTEGMER